MSHLHTTRLSDAVSEELAELARKSRLTKSEIIRDAIEQYLAFKSGKGWDPHRAAEVVEFCQLALDQWVKTNHPDLRDRILDATVRRMEKYHGG